VRQLFAGTASAAVLSQGAADLQIIEAIWEASADGTATSTGAADPYPVLGLAASAVSASAGVAALVLAGALTASGVATSTGSARVSLTTPFRGWGVPV
jgi:hypothetical protein